MTLAVACLGAALLDAGGATASESGYAGRGQDNAPPLFADNAALVEFLRSAEITEDAVLGSGVAGPRRLTLQAGGARLRAVFRSLDDTRERFRTPDGRYSRRLRDSFGFEVAAYRLSLLLGMDSLPPSTYRTVDRVDGAVQLWLENTIMERDRIERGLTAPRALEWARQIQEMLIFDELIGNIDRHLQSMLVDARWKLWLIDHTRAFRQGDDLRDPQSIRMVRRGLWEALRRLDRAAVEAAIAREIGRRATDDLLARRGLLMAHVQSLINQRGAEAVLW